MKLHLLQSNINCIIIVIMKNIVYWYITSFQTATEPQFSCKCSVRYWHLVSDSKVGIKIITRPKSQVYYTTVCMTQCEGHGYV